MVKCSVTRCNKTKTKLFATFIKAKFYYCKKHFKFYTGLFYRFKKRNYISLFKNKRRKDLDYSILNFKDNKND